MCLQFINALLSQTDDFEFRMHLRNEIVRNGLYDKLGMAIHSNSMDHNFIIFIFLIFRFPQKPINTFS